MTLMSIIQTIVYWGIGIFIGLFLLKFLLGFFVPKDFWNKAEKKIVDKQYEILWERKK